MKIEAPENPNYCAIVTTLQTFVELPGCDRIKAAVVYGTQVIVSKDAKPGDVGLYFPPETALSAEFCSENNLFVKPEYGNMDPTKKGFFEKHGRVKCVKFRGFKSEGFWIPLSSLGYLLSGIDFKEGDSFDKIDDHEICCKYISRKRLGRAFVGQAKVARPEDKLVEGQFRFHPDTQQLRRNLDMLLPDSIISISDKWHGTSVVIGNLLAKRELPWYERLAKSFGVKVQESEYAIVTSSRKVIKSVNGQARDNVQHYYTSDVWSYWSDRIKGGIPAGYTVYGEIVGYTATGEPVQKGYAYGCTPHVGAASSNSRLLVYRVTFTNADGSVFELPWLQMCGWCLVRGIETVPTLYWGRAGVSAGDLVPHLDGEDLRDWRDSFLQYLENAYVNDGDCPHNPGMPAEGIVVRIDHADGTCTALKLKNYRFLEHETKLLDAGEDNLEDSESAGDVVESDTI